MINIDEITAFDNQKEFHKKRKAIIYGILSFVAPFIILMLAYYKKGIYPGGPNTVLAYDLKAQYMPFYASLRYLGETDNSIFLNMSGALGNNFLGFAYYIFSPFAWITVLFPLESLPLVLYFTILVRIALCGLSFFVFILLSYPESRHYQGAFLLSCCYALMSYNIGYSVNLMWLDSVIMLPLLLLGIEQIIQGKKNSFFSVCVAISMIMNYYITSMSLVFVSLYTIVRLTELKKWSIDRVKKLIIGLLIGIGISLPIVLPGVMALADGKLSEASVSLEHLIRYNPIELLGQLFSGKYDTVLDDGLPFIFCGTATLLLVVFFFMEKRNLWETKCLYAGLIVFYLFSMCFVPMDRAMNGFNEATCFEVRYAYVFSTLLLCISYRGIDCFRDVLKKYNILSIAKAIGVVFVFVELYMNSSILIAGIMEELRYRPVEEYELELKSKKTLVEMIDDEDFYRISDSHPYSDNDGAWLGYNGFGYFSSSYNLTVMDYLGSLGECQIYHLLKDGYRTPLEESLFGAKYKLSYAIDKTSPDIIGTKGFYSLSRNDDALSLGYMIKGNKREDYKLSGDALANQNALAMELAGTDGVFVELLAMECEEVDSPGYAKHSRMKFLTTEDAPVMLYIEEANNEDLKQKSTDLDNPQTMVYVNGEEYGSIWKNDSTFIIYLGRHNSGEQIEIEVLSTVFLGNIHMDYMDDQAYQEVVKQLKKNQLKLTEHSSGHFCGTIDAGNGGYMLLSLPYMDGWIVKVDGNRTSFEDYRNALLKIPLSEGVHDIDIRYVSPGVYLGMIVGGISLALFIILKTHDDRNSRKAFGIEIR